MNDSLELDKSFMRWPCLLHALHVLALRLHQPFEVIACGIKDRAVVALKMPLIASMKSKKAIRELINSIDARISKFK
jgi:hypothetical protein